MAELREDGELGRALAEARVVAVLGAHSEKRRPAYYVPDFLAEQGYRVVPVNPTIAGMRLWGEPVRSTLAEIGEPVDIVDVFRRSSWLPDHLEDILAMTPLPKVVWMQLGVKHSRVAGALIDAGIDVVQDRCTLRELKRLGLPGR